MTRELECITGRNIGDLLADGKITEHDADQVLQFTGFLDAWGKPGPSASQEHAQARLDWLLTGDNGAYLGLTPEEVEQVAANLRAKIASFDSEARS